MNLVELGHAGPRVSPIVAGAWRLAAWGWSVQERLRWIEQCMELGVTTFDHADIYGGYTAEGLFGEALAARPALREHMQLVGKAALHEAVAALQVSLDAQDWTEMWEAAAGHEVP